MEPILLYFSGILVVGMIAQWLAWRLQVPSILLLLLCGFAAGQVADADKMIGERLLYPFVSLAVAIILFEGGLSLRLGEVRESGRAIIGLVTLGAIITAALVGFAAWWILDFPPRVAALLGAILCVSGPTVVGPVLQTVRPVRRVGAVARWEGIIVDPIGALLAVLVFQVIPIGKLSEALPATAMRLLVMIVAGTGLGFAAAFLVVQALRRYWVPDFLQHLFLLAIVAASFTAANAIQSESGLLTVTVLGFLLANQSKVPVHHLLEFNESLRVLLISALFIMLASLIKWSGFQSLGWEALLFLAAVFLIRPVAVWISTLGTGLNWRERTFLSWLAPRGIVAAAVASLFGLELVAYAGIEGGSDPTVFDIFGARLAPVTFLVIVGTVSVYGFTLRPLARRLGLADPNPQGVLFLSAEPMVRAIAKAVQAADFPVMLVDTDRGNVATARLEGFNAHCASVVSQFVREELDLSGIGRLVAMTNSAEVNALAGLEFARVFGRANVYQLSTESTGKQRREEITPHSRSRFLFDALATHGYLTSRFARGDTMKSVGLTEQFTYDDFIRQHGDSALVMFVVEGPSKLRVCAADSPRAFKAGQTLIALVDAPNEQPQAAARNH